MENLRPRKGKGLPKGVVLNFCSKIHGKADMSVSLRLRQVKPRTGQPKGVYGRSKGRGSPGPGGSPGLLLPGGFRRASWRRAPPT